MLLLLCRHLLPFVCIVLQDGLVNLLEAISQRPKMRTLMEAVVKKALALTMRDLSSFLLDDKPSVEVIDTSADKDDLATGEEIEDYF